MSTVYYITVKVQTYPWILHSYGMIHTCTGTFQSADCTVFCYPKAPSVDFYRLIDPCKDDETEEFLQI